MAPLNQFTKILKIPNFVANPFGTVPLPGSEVITF